MDLEITPIFLITVAALGFIAGVLGGMLGVGGSVIMIPGLVMMLGQDKIAGVNLHIYQAAAMIANVAVSVPAAMRHHKAKATCPRAIKWLLPSTLLFVLVGVWLSNQFKGTNGAEWLGRCLAVLLAYVIVINIRKLIIQWRAKKAVTMAGNGDTVGAHVVPADPDATRSLHSASEELIGDATGFGDAGESDDPEAFEIEGDADHGDSRVDGHDAERGLGRPSEHGAPSLLVDPTGETAGGPSHEEPDESNITPARCVAVGSVMGIIAGLMGVGGGAIAVPLQQLLLKLPLRRCIANSSAVICISAAVGAVYKNASLSQHVVEATGQPYRWQNSVVLALLLAPTCFLGGRLGAALTHALPLKWVRGAFIALLCVAAYKMAAIPW